MTGDAEQVAQIRRPILDPLGFQGDDHGIVGMAHHATVELVGLAGVAQNDSERGRGWRATEVAQDAEMSLGGRNRASLRDNPRVPADPLT